MANKKSDPTPASKKEAPKQTPAPMPKQEARQEAKQAVQSGTFGKDDIKALRIADVKPSVIQNLKEAAKVAAPAPTPAKVTAPAPTPVRATAPTPAPMPKQEAKQEAKQAVQSGTFGKDDVQALRAADVKPSVIQNLREAAKESAPAKVAAATPTPTPMPKQEAKQEARQAVQSGTFGKDDVQALRDAGVKSSVIQNLRETAKETSPVPSTTTTPATELAQYVPPPVGTRLTGDAKEAFSQYIQNQTPQVGQRPGETATVYAPGEYVPPAETVAPTETRTIRDASRLGEAIRIAGEGGLTKGEVNQITKQFDVSGADVVKKLDIINNKLKDNDLQGINLNSGAANMLIRQQAEESPTGYEAFLNRQGESLYGTGNIAETLKTKFGRPATEDNEAVAPSFITGGDTIRPGGREADRNFGNNNYIVPERLGGMPKSTDTVTASTTAPTTTPTVTTDVDPTTTPTVDTNTGLTPPANISSILTPIGETETGPATDLSIRGSFSAGGVGNIRLGKQKGKGRKGMAKTRTSAGRSTPKMNNIGIR